MKTNAIIRIVLFSIAILLLLGLLTAGVCLDLLAADGGILGFTHSGKLQGGTVSSTGEADAGLISQISVEWATGTIRIQSGDVDKITFSETGAADEEHKMIWKQSGSKLRIQFSDNAVSFFGLGISINSSISKDLTITVPRDWTCQELSLAVAAANVVVEDMIIDEVDFDSASGFCVFENCQVEDLSLDSASGDIHFSGTLDTLDCDAASADCVIDLTNVPSRIDMDTASGDLDLTLPENCGFTVSLDALSSDFSSEFPTTQSNGDHVYGDGSCRISIDAMSGDVTIRKGEFTPLPTVPSPGA